MVEPSQMSDIPIQLCLLAHTKGGFQSQQFVLFPELYVPYEEEWHTKSSLVMMESGVLRSPIDLHEAQREFVLTNWVKSTPIQWSPHVYDTTSAQWPTYLDSQPDLSLRFWDSEKLVECTNCSQSESLLLEPCTCELAVGFWINLWLHDHDDNETLIDSPSTQQ